MKNLILLSLLLLSSMIYGQVQFSVGASIGNVPLQTSYSKKTAIDYEYFVNRYDSLKFTTKVIRDIDYKTIYSTSESYQFYGNVHYPISKRINLVTGLGFDFHRFYINTIYTHIDKSTEELPTVKTDSILDPIFWGMGRKTYSLNDEYTLANSVFLVNMYVPLEVDYEVINNLRIIVGAKLNMGVYRHYDSFHTEYMVYESGYSTDISTIKETRGEAIKPFSLQGFAGIQYRFLKHFEIAVKMAQFSKSIVRKPIHNEEQEIFQKVDFLPYSPRTYSIGLNYYF